MSDETTLNVKGLDQLLKALKAKPPRARVGVLGDKAHRNGSGAPSNAEVGAAMEFGVPSKGIVARSFLRMPISEKLGKEMESSGALDKQTMADVVKLGSVVPWLRKIAVLAEGIVADGFSTSGFGKWAPWKDPNYTNNAGQILVDTTQLRNSITSEVRE